MNVTKTQKKQCLLISVLLACVLCIVGLFGIFHKKDERISASAAASTNESKLYWEAGASILTHKLTARMIRFTFHANKSVLDDGDMLSFVIYEGEDSASFNGSLSHVDYGGNSSNSLLNLGSVSEGLITIPLREKQDEIFSTSDEAVFRVTVDADTSSDVSIVAGIYPEGQVTNIKQRAVSDTRNWLYIYNAWSSATGEKSSNLWAEECKEFTAGTDTAAFILHDEYWIDSTYGVSMLANIPQEYKDLIAKGNVLVDEQTTSGHAYGYSYEYVSYKKHEEYFFVLQRDSTMPNLLHQEYDASKVVQYHGLAPGQNNESTISELHVGTQWANGYYYMGIVKKITEMHRGVYADDVTTTESYEVVDWSNALYVNKAEKAEEILGLSDLDISNDERLYLMDVIGDVPDTNTITVKVKYKKLSDKNNPSSAVEETLTFPAKSVYAYSKTEVVAELYKTKGVQDVSEFNVIYDGEYIENDRTRNYGERIVLQATGYEYSYDDDTQIGTLEVVYNDFQYKEFSIRVKNNDPENPLMMNCYTADVSTSIIDAAQYTTLTFDYEKMANALYGACLWIVEFKDENFTIGQKPDSIEVTQDGSNLTVTFLSSNEANLLNLSITAVAEIIDGSTPCTVNYQYVKLSMDDSGNMVEELITSDSFDTNYRVVLDYYEFKNFNKDFGATVNAALKLDVLEGEYFKPVSVQSRENTTTTDGTRSYTFVVQYEYNTLFKITNNKSSDVRYVALEDTLHYYGTDFVRPGDIPDGHRVEKLTSTSSDVRITADTENADDYKKTLAEVLIGTKEKKIIPIHITYTDKWHLTFEYFETYKNTPFALKKTYLGDISVKDYPNIYAMTSADICAATGIPAKVINIIKLDEKVDIAFDNISLYTATLGYGEASIVSIDYDGYRKEIKVPLSKYEDWVAGMGNPDWTIMMLNTKDKQYFQYTNDVEREKLYGLFSTAIFEEQVSDLNYYFRNNTGDGCMTIFEHTVVEGSRAYKFFYKLMDNKLTAIAGRVGMFFCDLVNDDNKMLYSYSFYLDGSRAESYISNGGADDAYDDDTAIENKGEDIADDIKDGWDKLTDKTKSLWQRFRDSKWDTVIVVVLCVAAGVVVVAVVWKYGRRLVLWTTSDTKKSSKSKRKSTSKSKSKNKGKK